MAFLQDLAPERDLKAVVLRLWRVIGFYRSLRGREILKVDQTFETLADFTQHA